MIKTYVRDAGVRRALCAAALGAATLFAMPAVAQAKGSPSPAAEAAADKEDSDAGKRPSTHSATKKKAHPKHAAAKKGGHKAKAKSRDLDRDADERPAHKERAAGKTPALSHAKGQDDFQDKKAAPPHGRSQDDAKAGHHAARRTAQAAAVEGGSRKASRHDHVARTAQHHKECMRDPVEIVRGSGEGERFSLTHCTGKPADRALEQLSVLLRPLSVPRPESLPDLSARRGEGSEVMPGIKAADAGLLSRIQALASQYPGKKITVVSGYRPGSTGSYHKLARAVDLKIEGVNNDELVTFCRSLVDTGCGYYPNSSFVHLDVRPRGTGHVYWIDASGPGEAPRYVASWPPAKDAALVEIPRPDHAAPSDEHTHPDAGKKRAGHGAGTADRDDEDGGDRGAAAAGLDDREH